MALRIFSLPYDFVPNKEATVEAHSDYITVSSTSSTLTSPGIITENAVSLKADKTYEVLVRCKKNAESTPYIYISTTTRRTYITNSTWGLTSAIFKLSSDEDVKVGILMEHAQDGHSYDVSEMSLREHVPNMARTVFDMTESNSLTLQKSEISVGRIKMRWDKSSSPPRLQIASATGDNFNVTVYNHLNAFNYSAGSGSAILRHGFVNVNSTYQLFYTDASDTDLAVAGPHEYYIQYSFTILVDYSTEV